MGQQDKATKAAAAKTSAGWGRDRMNETHRKGRRSSKKEVAGARRRADVAAVREGWTEDQESALMDGRRDVAVALVQKFFGKRIPDLETEIVDDPYCGIDQVLSRAEPNLRRKLELVPGHFYTAKDGERWCCFKVDASKPEHARADCVRVRDGRVEYFFLDGRYDSGGKREHTLLREAP